MATGLALLEPDAGASCGGKGVRFAFLLLLRTCLINALFTLKRKKPVKALLARCLGYDVEAEQVFMYRGEIIREKCIKHIPPDPAACKVLLSLRPEQKEAQSPFALAYKQLLGTAIRPKEPHEP